MSNAGPGLSPNKQSQSGKVSPTNEHGETVSPNYVRNRPDGRDAIRGGMPSGCLSASDTGVPQNTRGGKSNGFFATLPPTQPNAVSRDLGAPSQGTGGRDAEPRDLMRGKNSKYTPPRWG